jgi:type II secretory pathway component PulF
MPEFSYEAKKGPKEVVKGTIEERNREAAIDKLEQMGYIPVRVTAVKERILKGETTRKPGLAREIRPLSLFSRVGAKDLTVFTEQLASLVKAKLPLLEAMDVLFEQTENASLKKTISQIQKEIKDGSTLSQALGRHPKLFSALYVNMVNSGESGGVLEQTLLRLADFRNKEEEIKAKVSSALAYPIFIIIVGVITVFALVGFVIPRLSSLFSEMGQSLPLSTRMLISLSSGVQRYWYWAVILIAVAVFMLQRGEISKKKKIIFDRFKLKLPLLGDFMKKSVLARFSRTLAILLANGIPVFQALEISIPTVNNEVFKTELQKVYKDVIEGASLEEGMKNSYLFPRFMTNMLAVGERGGNLQASLLEIADFYERQLDKTTRVMTSLLEPMIILVVGLVVGFIVFAMLMPIFQINIGMG